MTKTIQWLMTSAIMLTMTTATADNWPQFRGANHDYLPTQSGLPTEWNDETNVEWIAPIPGEGWASPVVWGDHVFIATAVQEKGPAVKPRPGARGDRVGKDAVYRWELHCLNLATGEERWKRVVLQGHPRNRTHPANTYASETPVTDGERVYVYFGMMGLFCYDFDGELVWKKDLGGLPMERDWGTGSSPIMHEGILYLQIDNEEESFLVALDGETGDERWRKARNEGSSWSTPMIWRNRERTELVTNADTVRSYDPQSGELLWSLRYPGGRASASPVGDADVLYIGNEEREDGGGILAAVKAGASGDITPSEGEQSNGDILWWRADAGPDFSSPLLYEGHVYILARNRGQVSCYDAKTGAPAYEHERLTRARSFWASPWAYDGKVFCPDDSGRTHVLKPGPKLEVIGTNSIDDKVWSSPAFVDQTMILRGANAVYCIREH